MNEPGTLYREWSALPADHYDILYADPPWAYSGSPTKPGAAAKHYSCMGITELEAMRGEVARVTTRNSVCFMWATGPLLDDAVRLLGAWGFHYRGVAFVWVKTRKDGGIINGMGVRPSIVKPTTEFVLVGARRASGRPLPLEDEGVGQVVPAPRGAHSAKPEEVRARIDRLYGRARPRLEMFARGGPVMGWDRWGNEVEGG